MDRLRELVTGNPWFVRVLATVRDSDLPDAWVGAGVLRALVWGARFGDGFDPAQIRDVDVAFFDPADIVQDSDDRATSALRAAWPDVPWEATNQAAVHTWCEAKFGQRIAPLRSIHEAISTWPETATAVVVRLTSTGDIEVCAPLGLADLMNGVWRRNPRQVTVAQSRARLARQRPAQRWPGVTVVEP